MAIIPRAAIGLPNTVRSSDGSARPLLARGLRTVAVHYTGSNLKYAGTDAAKGVLGIQAYAINANKTFEYNYVVGQDGRVFEYAGTFRAAHSAGENTVAYGVLMLNGIGEPLTDAQVASFHALRRELVAGGWLAADHAVVPHHSMPGAATLCPGEAIEKRFAELVAEPQAPAPVPAPLPPPAPPISSIVPKPALRRGAKGAEVVKLQNLLNIYLYPTSVGKADGDFGPRTEAGVKQFQEYLGGRGFKTGVADGVYNWLEYSALNKLLAAQKAA